MKLYYIIFLLLFLSSCSKETPTIDISSNLVGDYEGKLVDEMNNIIEDDVVLIISKISNDVIKVQPQASSSQTTSFQVSIIKNANVITNLVSGSDVIMVIDVSSPPFIMGIDYSDSKTSFTGFKVN